MEETRDLTREIRLADLKYKSSSLQYTLRDRARYRREYRTLKKEMEK